VNKKVNNRMATLGAGLLLAVGALSFTSCAKPTAAASTPKPPEVEVAVVEQKDLPIDREWIGTLDGMVNAVIKAQVTGYLLTQNYAEGSFVRKGQLLFEIDPRPFQAVVDQANGQLAQATAQLSQAKAGFIQARAQLTSAKANQRKAQMDEDRYTPLAQQQAITQQDMDNAKQTNESLKAQVSAADAQVETAKAQIEAAQAGVTAAAADEPIKIGYAISKTGPFAPAAHTQSKNPSIYGLVGSRPARLLPTGSMATDRNNLGAAAF